MEYLHNQIHVQCIFNKIMPGKVYFLFMTSQIVVTFTRFTIYFYDSKVGSICWDQYILSRLAKFKTIRILNIDHFKLSYWAKRSCETGSP